MLKTFYRSYDPTSGQFYGFALPEYQDSYHAENPSAYRCPPLEVTADQLAYWRNTGTWGDDFQHQRFIPGGRLLRWPIDDPVHPAPADVWDAAHLDVKSICRAANLTQSALAARFGIPKRTVEDWCRGVAKCAPYIRRMMCECLGLLDK